MRRARPVTLKIFDWLVATGEPQAAEVRERLVRSAIDDKTTIIVGTVAIAVVVFLATHLSGDWWPLAWLAADLVIAGLRLAILRDAEGRPGARHQRAMILTMIAWTLVFAGGLFGCMLSGNAALSVLGAVYAVAVAGTIASRVAALPRYAALIIVLCYLPLGLGMAISDLPNMHLLAYFVPFWAVGMIAMMFQNFQRVTRMIRAELQIRRVALTDRLTGIPNRMYLEESLEALRGDLDRGDQFAILCLDLDGFKPVNDGYGHAIGDILLKAAAGRIENVLRGDDKVCRQGGDEFVVLLPGAAAVEVAQVAKRIIEAIAHPFDLESGDEVEISVSIGSALAPDNGRDPASLLSAADQALYAAKSAGKGIHRPYLERYEGGRTAMSA